MGIMQSLVCLLLGAAVWAFQQHLGRLGFEGRSECPARACGPSVPLSSSRCSSFRNRNRLLAFIGQSARPSSAIGAHQNRNHNQNISQSGSRKVQYIPASDYDSINNLLETAVDIWRSGGSLRTAYVRSRLSRLISQRQPLQKDDTSRLGQNIDTLFKQTMATSNEMSPKDLTTIILA
jgi:hypothetical protein